METTEFRDAKRSTNLQYTLDDFHTNNDRIFLVENVLGQDSDDTGKDSDRGGFFTSLGGEFIHESGKLVEQVINNLSCHDAHTHLCRVFPRFLFNIHIEGENCSILRMSLFVHDRNLCDIAFVNRTNSNRADRNWRIRIFAKKLKQRLQSTQGRCLDQHTLFVGTEFGLETFQITHDLGLDVLLFVLGTDDHNRSSGHYFIQVITNNFYTKSTLDLFVMNVFRFNTHFSAWWRRKQTTNFRYDWTIQCTEYSFVSFSQISIHNKDINGHSQTIDCLYFQYSSLEVCTPHESLPNFALGHLAKKHKNVLHTLSGNSRSRNQRNKVRVAPILISHFPVKIRVDTLFRKLQFCVGSSAAEFRKRSFLLNLECVTDRGVFASLPGIAPINFVQSNHKGNVLLTKHVQTFYCLLFEAVHQIHYKNRNITQRGTSGTKICERFVTGCIDYEHSRNCNVKVFGFVEFFGLHLEGLPFEVGGTDLLCNTSCFSFLNIGFTNFIQQLCLPGIDVTHDDRNRTSEIILSTSSNIRFLHRLPLFLAFVAFLGLHHFCSFGSIFFLSQFGHFNSF
mmetsp:Transcript_19535/g.48658  ORF Transcript_19535/g.48658 Transcript_19535/m.48658 type:complete len:563 (-) Transcript_19535:692-2380(-)